jgi:hypothetical protein
MSRTFRYRCAGPKGEFNDHSWTSETDREFRASRYDSRKAGPAKINANEPEMSKTKSIATLSKDQRDELLETLEERFEKNWKRHAKLKWDDVYPRLALNARALWSLSEMERTGGEPDVIGQDQKTGEFLFFDCSPESPLGRRSVCYDPAGQKKREKEGLPVAGNVLDMAAAMGIEPLTEEQYRELHKVGSFDTRSQSWLKTPDEITKLGGALFAEKRYERLFVGANTAPCFYKGRGFRGLVRV